MQLIHLILPCVLAGDPAGDVMDKARYLRPSDRAFVFECEIVLKKSKGGSSIESVTERGKTKLTVTSRYDERDRLTGAEASIGGDKEKTVTVAVAAGKARVQRKGQEAQQFEVPEGVIVTSAPDWTDTFLLCRRYDRTKGGKQSFPGLWIHPEQAGQSLTFAIERTGQDTIEHAGKKLTLDRHTIWLRGNSTYAAWADARGKMIKLVPLPSKEKATNWLILEGYEESAAGLRPR
jgi:hypothetical protein